MKYRNFLPFSFLIHANIYIVRCVAIALVYISFHFKGTCSLADNDAEDLA